MHQFCFQLLHPILHLNLPSLVRRASAVLRLAGRYTLSVLSIAARYIGVFIGLLTVSIPVIFSGLELVVCCGLSVLETLARHTYLVDDFMRQLFSVLRPLILAIAIFLDFMARRTMSALTSRAFRTLLSYSLWIVVSTVQSLILFARSILGILARCAFPLTRCLRPAFIGLKRFLCLTLDFAKRLNVASVKMLLFVVCVFLEWLVLKLRRRLEDT